MMYLSRLTLSRSPSVLALQALLAPADPARRIYSGHRLVWTAFAGQPDAKRDFLWRDEGQGRFIILSSRPPQRSELFDPPEIKEFAPSLRAGDEISFLLRANATRTLSPKTAGGTQPLARQHVDVVMHALKDIPKAERAAVRNDIAQASGAAWMQQLGKRHGFLPVATRIDGYHVVELPGKAKRRPRFGVLDIEGVLRVEHADRFLAGLTAGFGRAKAFGCGLMLIRRL